MRQIFTLLLFLYCGSLAAQTYNNEWIDHSKTYYKFKAGKNGLFRVSKDVLTTAGIGDVPVENLEIYRNGVLVPFFPSVPSGPLPDGGYIELWCEMNDGVPDRPLYREARFQHSTARSLFSDTAVYFMTRGSGPNSYKVNEAVNDVNGPHPSAEPYFMYTYLNAYTNKTNPGYASVLPEYVYLSAFDQGEFRSSADIGPSTNHTVNLTNLFVYSSGPASTFTFGLTGNAQNNRTFRALINGTVVKDTTMDFFNDYKTSVPVSTSLITTATVPVRFINTSTISSDRMAVSHFSLTYPRQFNFGNVQQFPFDLPAKVDGYYLEITNFQSGGIPPVLYDLTHRKRYTAVMSGTTARFVLPASAEAMKLVMASQVAATITQVTALTPRNFINYASQVVTSDKPYLLITHSLFFTGTSGNNPINDYKNYRESAAGGGYKVIVADIAELTDQFAFGIKHHPSSIKNYLRYARNHFASQPRYAFLVGRGVTYQEYYTNRNNVDADRIELVPTFGYPGSDNMLSAEGVSTPVGVTPIGRLSAINAKEVEDYLEKVKEYENVQQTAPNTLAGREWMKNVVHVTGSSEAYLGSVLCNYMGVYERIIEDTLFGGHVSTFCKVSTNSVEQLTATRLTELFQEGISLLTYFGHSSSTTLEFNISNPENYNNQGKYPVFSVNGCNAGNFFTFYTPRLSVAETLSEKFVLAKQRGSIAFMASTHLGIVSYLNLYLNNFYKELAQMDFGKSLGETNRDALRDLFNASGGGDFYSRMHAEQVTLHGDPAIMINAQLKPDYVMEESLIRIDPTYISVAENNYQLKVRMVNLGKAYPDSIVVEIKQLYPNGQTGIVYRGKIKGIRYADSLLFDVPIVATRDKGLNKITVTLDADQTVDEISESNNTASKEFFIYDEEARPVSPFDFSIVNDPAIQFYASTANPFSQVRDYAMEIDTTLSFSSPELRKTTISSAGGILEFNPGFTPKDSTVYYWRVATVPPAGDVYKWNNASFTYLKGPSTGFGQEHYFQHLESLTEHVSLQNNRVWTFDTSFSTMTIPNGVYPYYSDQQAAYTVYLNDHPTMSAGCTYNEVIINVVDPNTFKPWVNLYNGPGGAGQYNSDKSCGSGRQYNFMYSLGTAARRKAAMDFLAIVPNGYYVVIRSNSSPQNATYPTLNTYSKQWMADTTLYGSGNSLYHVLFNAGFVDIDQFSFSRAWSFIYKKNDLIFQPRSAFTPDSLRGVSLAVSCPTVDSVGYINSPKFGPASAWHEVRWSGESLEMPVRDKVSIDVVGIDNNDLETVLYQLNETQQRFDVSAVDPQLFPYIRLRMRNIDSVAYTPYQLKYWRVLYDPVPEGMLAPNLSFSTRDTLDIGQILDFSIPFKNITKSAFDSVSLKLNIIDNNNVPHTIDLPKLRPLQYNDTAMLKLAFNTRGFPGKNTLYLDVNPDFAQPEQYHFNNFLFRDFYVKPDQLNPLLDVTFDGVHIINRDIVSARPHVQIRLKDEAKYMLLNDTSISSVQVRYPDNSVRTYHFDNDTLRFTPATSGEDNSAILDFFPDFTQQVNPEGDDYEMIINAKDESGNTAGTMEYRIAFRVISKPMISNLLNYPNPFSTSTAFVFTLTGSELPQNMKIQILTVTGKIVREITMNELGPLHIGRNITEFKWNGTDQYGQKLANGVYLYRVVTTLNGQRMDKYKAEGDNTDKYFNNGYGKMYLMR